MMSAFSKKTLIMVAVYVAIYAGLIFLLLLPQIKSLQNNKRATAEKQLESAENQKKIATYERINKNPEEMKKVTDSINNYLPDQTEISRFIVQIEGLAKDLGMVIDDFSIEDKSKNQKSTSSSSSSTPAPASTDDKNKDNGTKFTLTAKSSYNNVLNFIKQMENLARFNSVSTLDLSTTDTGDVSLKMNGSIYNGQ